MLCKIYSIHSLGEYFPGGGCFLDYGDSGSVGSCDKFIYAATAKTSPGDLLCYLLRTCVINGWVNVFMTHFSKTIRKNQKPWKGTRALLIACHCQLNVKENKSSNKDFLWNKRSQITKESLQLICQFLFFNS